MSIYERAQREAATGNHVGFADVVFALKVQGHLKADTAFESQKWRERLNSLCDTARAKLGRPIPGKP